MIFFSKIIKIIFGIMYIAATISTEDYSNNEINALIEIYKTYNKDMSPVYYTFEQVERTKKSLLLVKDIIDAKVLDTNSTDEDKLQPVVILTNKVVAIIKNQINSLTDKEWIIMSAMLTRIIV
jgi:hypothetical protein